MKEACRNTKKIQVTCIRKQFQESLLRITILAAVFSLPCLGKLSKSKCKNIWNYRVSQKMWFKLIFEFLTMGRVFLGVKNDFNNFGNKKIIRLLSKILSKLTLFIRKMQKFWCFYELIAMSRMEKRI